MDKLTKQIQSDDIDIVYQQVTDVATIWAICGFIDYANNLLEKLWSLGLDHSKNTRLKDEGFQFLWTITSKKPNLIPFQLKDIDLMQAKNWQEHFMPYWNNDVGYTLRVKEKKWTELSNNDLELFGIGLAYDEQNLNKTSDEKQQLEGLKAITKFLNTCNPVGYSLMNSLECASILAARNGLIKEAEELLIQWAKAYKLYWSNTSVSSLMKDISTAKILLTGVLAPIFELTEDKCKNDLQVICTALDERMTKGCSLVYEKLKWEDLLESISVIAIQKAEFDYEEESVLKNWLGFTPATKDEISNAETRLNIKLPKEYKDFLMVSNGFNPFLFTPTLLEVDKIDWLKKIDSYLVESWAKSMADIDNEFVKSFSNSILIGGLEDEQQLLLIPSTESENWECWFFANWVPGEIKYLNFRYYMEHQLQELEAEE